MASFLVTGGAGFLGSFIADVLTEDGHDVTLLDREPSPYLRADQQEIVGDILNADLLREAAEGKDYVYHLAALADMNDAHGRPEDTAQVNILGTLNVMSACRAAGVKRFMFASTVYVYSQQGSFYRCSKQAAEAYIEEYRRQYGLEYTILRYGSLYGPRADETNGVYRLLRSAAFDGTVEFSGTRDDVREYIHVEDAARLSVEALGERYANQNLVITGHNPMRLEDLFTMFGEILGRPVEVAYHGEGNGGDHHYRITPYSYIPKAGRKLTSNYYVDMGQGILEVLDYMHQGEEEGGR